jgi:hypothetical protein
MTAVSPSTAATAVLSVRSLDLSLEFAFRHSRSLAGAGGETLVDACGPRGM